jgi:4'-phosphopantetheinyl transferase EntD
MLPDLAFRGLFTDKPVVVEELFLADSVPPCHPREAEQVAAAVFRRRQEYAAGRYCARRALSGLGIEGFILLNGPDRAPIWPTGVAGAITHTGGPGGYCAAVVGRLDRVLAVSQKSSSPRRSVSTRLNIH